MSSSPATLTGNLTADPELKFLGSGTPKLSFGLACSHIWTDQSGEKQEKTSFFNIVAWRNLAEEAAKILEKGLRVTVVGRLEQRTYEDKDGQNRSIIELSADEISVSCRAVESITRKQRNETSGRPVDGGKSRPSVPTRAKSAQATMVVEEDEPF